jgi:NADH-ubiquinone oxidoreductase chain 4
MIVIFFLTGFFVRLWEGNIIIYLFFFFLFYANWIWLAGGEVTGAWLNYDNSMWSLVFLSIFLLLVMFLSEYSQEKKYISISILYYLMLFTMMGLVGCFMLGDFFIFYIRFEFTVIPIFLLILGWGYRVNRLQAGLFMFLYTLVTSLPFLLLLLWLYGDFSMSYQYFFFTGVLVNEWWWLFVFLVFMVKLPVYLVHLWLPKAHVEAPVVGSMILAGVLLKLGGYGVYKGVSVIFFEPLKLVFLVGFSIVGAFLVGLYCLRQVDIKILVAYSSIVHIGPVMGCFLLMSRRAFRSGILIILSHGICSSGLFYILNVAYDRLGRRSLMVLRGGLSLSPVFCMWWFFFSICNIGCPPTFNFFSEVFMLIRIVPFFRRLLLIFFFILFLGGLFCVFFFVVFNHGWDLKDTVKFGLDTLGEFLVISLHCYYLLIFIFFISEFS